MTKKRICELCKKEITEYDIPDVHHKDGNHNNNNKDNLILVHHKCHLIEHDMYPKNYDNLRQLVEAKEDIQKTRMRLSNQISSLKRLGFEEHENQNDMFKNMKKEESRLVKEYGKIVRELPIYKEWLSALHGVGEDISSQIIGILGDISRFERISNLWSYCGYGLYEGNIQGLKKEQKHNYNTKMRTIMYRLVTNGFIMHKKNSYYGKLYDEIKKHYREKYPDKVKNTSKTGQKYKYTDIHIHLMSIRKVAKIFLKDLWIVWRILEDLPISEPYEVAYLGHTKHEIPHFKMEKYV